MSRVALLVATLQCATACTSVLFRTGDNCTVVVRSMELGLPAGTPSEFENIYTVPRGQSLTTLHGNLPNSTFGYVAFKVTSENITIQSGTTEGINEVGLTVSIQTHDLAQYEAVDANKTVRLGDLSVATFLLGCCKDVDEAAATLGALNIVYTPVIGRRFGNIHWSVQDARGQSRVFEYVNGRLHVYNNTLVGVVTNDPGYEWQLGNLNQFAAYPVSQSGPTFAYNVTSSGPFSTVSVQADSSGVTRVPVDISHGVASTRLLPGGYAPPDRFVKMFLMKQLAVHHAAPATLEEGLVLATGLINSVHIPRGVVAGSGHLEYTNWVAIKVPKAPLGYPAVGGSGFPSLLYYRTYGNPQWKVIDLSSLDFSGNSSYAPISLDTNWADGVADATPQTKSN